MKRSKSINRPGKSLRFESLEVKRLLAADGAHLVSDSFTVEQNSRDLNFDVLSNDTFDDDYAGAKIITDVSLGSGGGRISVADDGQSLNYSPPADFSGRETFNYFVDEEHSVRVTVSVEAPLRDDAYEFLPTESTYTLNVLDNDPFWEGYEGEKNITLVSASTFNAGVKISEDGQSLTYERVEHRYGTDSIVYIVDGKYPARATVEINSPLTSDRFQMVEFDDAESFDVRRNDRFWRDYPGERVITHILDVPDEVSATVSEDGRSIVFDPQQADPGHYTVRYVMDSTYETTATFQVEMPTRNDYASVDKDSQAFAIDVLSNDYYWHITSRNRIYHVDTVTGVTQSKEGGTVAIGEENEVLYTPPAGFVGQDEFTYTADGEHTATVTVNVRDPFEDGSYRNDYYNITKGTLGNVLTVLDNDFSGSGYTGDRIITSVDQVEGATVAIAESGKHLVFTPTDDSVDSFQFTYTVDGQLSASVRVNSRTVASYEYYEFSAPQTATLPIVRDLAIPENYQGAGVITSITQPSNGAVATIAPDGKGVVVELGPGAASFEYTLDGKYTGTAVTGYPNRLSQDYGVVHMNSDEPVQIDVLANDFSSWTEQRYGRYQGDKIVTSVSSSENGTATVVDGKYIHFTPAEDFVGSESLQYVVDGFLAATINIDVARLLRHDRVHVDPGTTGTLNLLGNDLVGGDYEGALEITSVSPGESGATIAIAEDGKSVQYTPADGFAGTDAFEYTVDGQLKANVTVEVNETAADLYSKFDSLEDFKSLVITSSTKNSGGGGGDLGLEDAVDAVSPADPGGRDHSETNVQVEGVDEADLIETDSDYIYTLTHGQLVITRAWPADDMEVMSTTDVVGSPIGQYWYEDRLTVISQNNEPIVPWQDDDILVDSILPWYPSEPKTHITVFDVTDRANPSLVQRSEIEGAHVQTRRIDDFVFAVVRDNESLTVYREWVCEDENETQCHYETEEEFQARLENEFPAIVEDLLPNYESYGADGELVRTGLVVEPEDMFVPISENASSLISIIALDVTNNEPGLATTAGVLTTGGSELYVTTDDLYVFENHYSWSFDGEDLQDSPSTKIMKFNLDSETGSVGFAATGQVPGRLLDQFSADEYDGHLRVATTVSNWRTGNYSGSNENALFVLRDDQGILETVGTMQNLALNESIQSVRYFGDQALVTTFQTIDPLFSIDLSDHTNPTVKGYLTLPGFSSYMQFVSEDKVLTIGRNSANGFGGVTQISLFDVSNILEPTLVDQFSWANSSSSVAETDHLAFGWFARHGTLAIPSQSNYEVRTDEDGDGYQEHRNFVTDHQLNAFGIDVEGEASITLNGVVDMDSPLLRSAYIGDKLYAVAADSIKSTPIATPNEVIAEVNIKPPEVEEPEVAVTDPRVALLRTLSDGARQDLAALKGVNAEEIMLVAAETEADRSKVLVRSGDEHYVYNAMGDQLELSRSDYRPTTANVMLDWHNEVTPADTNGDDAVTPIDVLVVINAINAGNGGELPTGTVMNQLDVVSDEFKLDVNGDGFLTALDALQIINELNQKAAEQAAAEPPPSTNAVDFLFAVAMQDDDDEESDESI